MGQGTADHGTSQKSQGGYDADVRHVFGVL